MSVYSLTLSYTPRSMGCDFWASFLAHTFVSPCLGCEPKVKVATFDLCTMLNLAKIVSLGTTCLASCEQLFLHEQCLCNWCPKTIQNSIIRYEITISSKNVCLHVRLDFVNKSNLINSWWGNPQLLYPYSFGLIFLLLWWQVLVIIEGVDILHLNLIVIQLFWRCFFVSSWTQCKFSCFIYPLLLILMMGEGFKFSKSMNVMYFQKWRKTTPFPSHYWWNGVAIWLLKVSLKSS